MMVKNAKKKDANDVAATTEKQNLKTDDEATQKKIQVPLWIEWSDQDIANEKWELKKDKNLHSSYFDDPEGPVWLPESLQCKVVSWKRPAEMFPDKVVIVDPVTENSFDLIKLNKHLLQSEFMCHIISCLSSFDEISPSPPVKGQTPNSLKFKQSTVKEQKDSKMEKNRKDVEVIEKVAWKPWDCIWPKEGSKPPSLPCYNACGKYAVRLFWMGCFRKIIVDDSIPCDENDVPLLPFAAKKNEIWLPLVTKALLKVASLSQDGEQDYEVGDFHLIYSLLGWLPEPIPIFERNSEEIWNMLLKLLPNWKLHLPLKRGSKDGKENLQTKPAISTKESKEKSNKQERLKEEQKKPEKNDKDQKNKDKLPPLAQNSFIEPEVVVFASVSSAFSNYCSQSKYPFQHLKGVNLHRKFANHVVLNYIRNCPLVALPILPPVPRWKLLRRKKDLENIVKKVQKEPKFLKLSSPFLNYKEDCTAYSQNDLKSDLQSTGIVHPQDTTEDRRTCSFQKVENELEEGQTSENNLWIEFDDFLQSFSSLFVYHKPHTYNFAAKEIMVFEDTNSNKLNNDYSSMKFMAQPSYLTVDSLKETEVVVTFHSFSKWLGGNGDDDNQSISSVPGFLILSPYQWNDITIKPTVLKIHTNGVKSAVLTLKPGRHTIEILKFAPLGYHLSLSSSQLFVMSEGKTIFPHYKRASAQFIDLSTSVFKQLKDIIHNFNDVTSDNEFLLGVECQSAVMIKRFFNLFFQSFTDVIKRLLNEDYTGRVQFSLEVLGHKLLSLLPNHQLSLPRPSTPKYSDAKLTSDGDIKLTPQCIAARKIQNCFKSFKLRKLTKAGIIGTTENMNLVDDLTKVWNHIELQLESVSMQVYQEMCMQQPAMFKLLHFHDNQWQPVLCKDLTGSYVEYAVNSCFVVCRETFYIEKPVMLAAKVYSHIKSCCLRVVNNDSYEEMKSVFTEVVPQVFHPNERGYSFVAMVKRNETVIPSGKFQLQIIGEDLPLLQDSNDGSGFCRPFSIISLNGYYIPSCCKRFFRYKVNTTQDVMGSLRLFTSKKDVLIKLQICNGKDIVMISRQGVGYVDMPAFVFHKEEVTDGECQKEATKNTSTTKDNCTKLNSYFIEAYVMKDSWPLTQSQWKFVESLRSSNGSQDNAAEYPDQTSKNAAGKNRKGNTGKDSKTSRSRPESGNENMLDTKKAHWILHIAVNSEMESCIDIKKDNERYKQIKATKSAWEEVEQGRAAKAQGSRLKYLESLKLTEKNLEWEDGCMDSNHKDNELDRGEELFIEPPAQDPPLKTFNVSQFLRSSGKRIRLDSYHEEATKERHAATFKDFHSLREVVFGLRHDDHINRGYMKEVEMKEYVHMQNKVDEDREKWLQCRETYMSSLIPSPVVEENPPQSTTSPSLPSPKPKSSKAKGSKTPVKSRRK